MTPAPGAIDAKVFFDTWTSNAFRADRPWTDLYPTPLGALEALRAAAAEAGVSEPALRAAVGDLVPALLLIMLEAPAPAVPALKPSESRLAEAGRSVEAIGMAIHYLDGLRATLGDDVEAAAELMLHHLARQGFVLRATERHLEPAPLGEAVAPPADVAARFLPH